MEFPYHLNILESNIDQGESINTTYDNNSEND